MKLKNIEIPNLNGNKFMQWSLFSPTPGASRGMAGKGRGNTGERPGQLCTFLQCKTIDPGDIAEGFQAR